MGDYSDVREGGNEKKITIMENVVLLMDSNRRHIDVKQFWNKTKKLKVSEAADLLPTIDKYDFQNVEHVIIGTGTNDSDRRSAEQIFPDLVMASKKLLNQYNMNVYVSQIPPRAKMKKEVVRELNSLIASGLPESVNPILQNELKEQHLCDEKHIAEKRIGLYVKNMKNKIKEVLGITPNHDKNRNLGTSPRRSSNGTRHRDESTSKEKSAIVEQLLAAMEQSSSAMMNNFALALKNLPT